jgi:hypothetical protein
LNRVIVAPDIALEEKIPLVAEGAEKLERRNAEGMDFARSFTTLDELRDRPDLVIVG